MSVLMVTDTIRCVQLVRMSEIRDAEGVPGVAGYSSKSDAIMILWSRRVAQVVKSLVDVQVARPEGVTLKCSVLRLPLATSADTRLTSA